MKISQSLKYESWIRKTEITPELILINMMYAAKHKQNAKVSYAEQNL